MHDAMAAGLAPAAAAESLARCALSSPVFLTMPAADEHAGPMTIRLAGAILVTLLLMTGCGGGGSGSSNSSDPIPTGAPINLSGIATFDRVPTTASAGLNYAGTTAKPIRGAVVEVRSSGGTHVLYRTVTDDVTGAFTVQAPSNATVRLVVLAAMGTPTAPQTTVVDNARGNAQYATYITVTTATVDLAGQNVHAGSGWDGTAYTGSRAAAPFAILDTAHDVRAMIAGADPGAVLHPLVVGWSDLNDGARIGTSHFSPSSGKLFILGEADVDTDEYDDHVIAHEMGHWFENYYSRSDSMGGPHGFPIPDILDETVAFGEGFGNAFSGMVTRNRYYRDTKDPDQAFTALDMDLEDDSVASSLKVRDIIGGSDNRTVDGGWSEASIQEILFDVFDGGDGTPDYASDDLLNLGFKPIYDVMVGPQKTTPGFTSIYSFLTYLKAQAGVSTTNVDNLALSQDIGVYDQFEQTGAGLRRYTTLPPNGTIVTLDIDSDPLTTYATYGDIDSDYPGNKLYNWMLFRATIATAGSYRLRVSPSTGGDVEIVRGGGLAPAFVDQYYAGDERLDFSASAGDVVTFAVGSFSNASFPSSTGTPFTIRLGSPPASIGKPAAPPAPVEGDAPEDIAQVPRSNG
jgi:hypothetical protein